MGFFDLFKRKKEEPVVKEIEKISYEKLFDWGKTKTSVLDNDEKVFHDSINSRISELIKELKDGIKIVGEIDWEKVKAEERLKLIVRENLDNYISYLNGLVSSLEELEEFNEARILDLFKAFEKKAGMSYQKATILIGKELAVLQEGIKNFFRDLDRMKVENKELMDNVSKIKELNEKFRNLEYGDEMINGINDGIGKNDKEIAELNNTIEGLKGDVVEIKKSDEYKSWEKMKETLEGDNVKLGIEIRTLKEMIDFKVLAKAWHKNKEEMEAINNYRFSFKESFQKDNEILGKVIQSLDNKEKAGEKFEEVVGLLEKVRGCKLAKSPGFEIEDKIGKLVRDVEGLNEDRIKEEKKREKLVSGKLRILEDVGEELKVFDVELENV